MKGAPLRLYLRRGSRRADPRRAHRMGLEKAPVKLAAETALRDILDG
jgi:hypothetical protein